MALVARLPNPPPVNQREPWLSIASWTLNAAQVLANMSDDVLAFMGISGFGKKSKQRQLDPNRFEKNKREEVGSRLECIQRA